MPHKIDLVLHNANIITMDSELPRAESMVISNERIIAIGTTGELQPFFKQAMEVIDGQGRTVLPGFIDTHTHLAGLGRRLLHIDFGKTRSSDEALQLIKEKVVESPPRKLVLGYNWDETNWETPIYLTKQDLDPISPDNPVVMIRVCGHLASLNSIALARLEIDADHPGVDRDSKTGRLTGVLRDYPLDIRKLESQEEDLQQTLISACQYANSVGITSVHENLSYQQLPYIAQYIKLHQKKLLTVRVYTNLETEFLEQLAGLELPSGLGDEYFRLGGVKVFADGSLGAQTAALSQPYNDDPETDGRLLFTEADYEFLIRKANELGLQVNTHAIGDRGIDFVLQVQEKHNNAKFIKQLRHTIIHAEFLTATLIARVKKLNILLLQQPNFAHRWGLPDSMYDWRLGPNRARQLNNFRRVLDAGIKVAFGSDCMPMDPLYGIYSAVTHPNSAIRISVEEAIRLYTADAAFASFEEQVKGSLSLGKLADFIVLSANPFEIPPEELRNLRILETYLGGNRVYSRL
ncbi:MAG: amidohydrolase [Candidatus Thorarchaeota archaeon]